MFVLNPSDIEREALKHGEQYDDLRISPFVILTFNQPVLDTLRNECGLERSEWKASDYSPYASPKKVFVGELEQTSLHVIIPQMGASALTALCEELIHFGAEVIMLVCASWSLGDDYLAPGEIHLPEFAVGMDGTSIWYGNQSNRVEASQAVSQALQESLEDSGQCWKSGGVGSHEAIYRISKDQIEAFRREGCLSLENGETAALFSLGKENDIPIGVLLQPYLDLSSGWSMNYMNQSYRLAGKHQTLAALQAMKKLAE